MGKPEKNEGILNIIHEHKAMKGGELVPFSLGVRYEKESMEAFLCGERIPINLTLYPPGENAVGGYIHLIGRSQKSNPSRRWTYPKERLRNGVPLDFRRGQCFLIKRFMPSRSLIYLTHSLTFSDFCLDLTRISSRSKVRSLLSSITRLPSMMECFTSWPPAA